MYTVILFLLFPLAYCCPDAKELSPCTCWTQGIKWHVHCSGFENAVDIQKSLAVLKPKRFIYSLTIEKSTFNYLPSDFFKDIKCVMLVIKNCAIMSLAETEKAFVGLEGNLLALHLENLDFMSEWTWSSLNHLQLLIAVQFKDTNLEEIRPDVADVATSHIGFFHFINCGITKIDAKAFATVKRLTSLTVSRNFIFEFSRSMFPNPAKSLAYLDLSYNEIRQLPADLFSNMPRLKSLDLYGNQIVSIGEKTMLPIWNHLKYFDVRKNEISCDCRLKWLTSQNFPEEMFMKCQVPLKFHGKDVKTMKYEDLIC